MSLSPSQGGVFNVYVLDQHKACAGSFTFATECGSKYKYAAPECCPGLVCQSKKCVEPAEICAGENKRAKFCDTKEGPITCYNGLVCHEHASWRCVKGHNTALYNFVTKPVLAIHRGK